MLTPEYLLPSLQDSSLVPVDSIFENHRLEDEEIWHLQNLGVQIYDLIQGFGTSIEYSREDLGESSPWLEEWAVQMDQ